MLHLSKVLLVLAVGLQQIPMKAQTFPFWGTLEKGPYAVGFRDTVLLNEAVKYNYHQYSGPKPFFISIWYPAKAKASASFMRFRDYMDYGDFPDYSMIVDSLRSRYHGIYIQDAVCKNINTMEPIDFDEKQRLLFSEILQTPVFATRKLKPVKKNFPVIYYHHGAQSTAFDNVVFCEYMASVGYVVVSSNYLWPVEGRGPLGAGEEIGDMAFVISAIKKLLEYKIPFMVGAGHSWGGQALLQYDTLRAKPFREIIAFHTTIEDKSLEEAKEWWPHLFDIFKGNTTSMTTPTILLAPEIIREGIGTFLLFRQNKTTPYTFITIRTNNITHDGFITLGNLRGPFAQEYQLVDSVKLMDQHRVYQQILRVTRQLIEQREPRGKTPTLFPAMFALEKVN